MPVSVMLQPTSQSHEVPLMCITVHLLSACPLTYTPDQTRKGRRRNKSHGPKGLGSYTPLHEFARDSDGSGVMTKRLASAAPALPEADTDPSVGRNRLPVMVAKIVT